MPFKRIFLGFAALLALGMASAPAIAKPPPNILGTVGICDPNYPTRCAIVAADGTLQTTGGGGGGGGASATAAAAGTVPVVAGVNKPVAIDLFSSTSVLPKDATGAVVPLATSTLQTSGNASLTTIGTNTGTTATNTGTTATNTGATTTAITAVTGTKAPGTAAASALLVGGVFNTTPPTLTNGQQAAFQFTSAGALITNAGAGLAQGSTTSGQTGTMIMGAVTTAAPTYTTAQTSPISMDVKGAQRVLLMDTTGTPLDPTAASAVQCGATTGAAVGCAIASKQATLDAAGAAIVPQAGTSQRTLTATNLSSNTNTTICPTATNPVATEIYFTTSGVGVGLNGQTLTSATPGATTTNSPDFAVGTAGTLYTAPVGISNAITAYGAAGVVRCIQTLRQ